MCICQNEEAKYIYMFTCNAAFIISSREYYTNVSSSIKKINKN